MFLRASLHNTVICRKLIIVFVYIEQSWFVSARHMCKYGASNCALRIGWSRDNHNFAMHWWYSTSVVVIMPAHLITGKKFAGKVSLQGTYHAASRTVWPLQYIGPVQSIIKTNFDLPSLFLPSSILEFSHLDTHCAIRQWYCQIHFKTIHDNKWDLTWPSLSL